MKTTELRALAPADVEKELLELLKTQFNLRMYKSTQQLTNTSQLKKVRREIARTRTVLAEKARQA